MSQDGPETKQAPDDGRQKITADEFMSKAVNQPEKEKEWMLERISSTIEALQKFRSRIEGGEILILPESYILLMAGGVAMRNDDFHYVKDEDLYTCKTGLAIVKWLIPKDNDDMQAFIREANIELEDVGLELVTRPINKPVVVPKETTGQ